MREILFPRQKPKRNPLGQNIESSGGDGGVKVKRVADEKCDT